MERTEVVHKISSTHWGLQFASAHICACVQYCSMLRSRAILVKATSTARISWKCHGVFNNGIKQHNPLKIYQNVRGIDNKATIIKKTKQIHYSIHFDRNNCDSLFTLFKAILASVKLHHPNTRQTLKTSFERLQLECACRWIVTRALGVKSSLLRNSNDSSSSFSP